VYTLHKGGDGDNNNNNNNNNNVRKIFTYVILMNKNGVCFTMVVFGAFKRNCIWMVSVQHPPKRIQSL
jgi:hypothetical protein